MQYCQANIESLDLIIPGHDYGWPIREGNFVLDPYGDLTKVYPLPLNDSSYKITYPVAEYDHDEGRPYQVDLNIGETPSKTLEGKYLFGDIPVEIILC